MAGKNATIAEKAEALALPFCEELGLNLWDVRFVKEGADWFLRFIIDKEGGVNINDCEALSRAVDAPLDEEDFIEQAYHLEISSPGLNRELTKERHFEQMNGQPILVKLYKAVNGSKEAKGILTGKTNQDLLLCDDEGNTITLPLSDIASVRLDDDHFFEI